MEYRAVTVPFEPIKRFLVEAWIDNRLSYYSRESERNRRWYSLMAESGEMLFAVTLIAAVHAVGLGEIRLVSVPAHTGLLAAATILPGHRCRYRGHPHTAGVPPERRAVRTHGEGPLGHQQPDQADHRSICPGGAPPERE